MFIYLIQTYLIFICFTLILCFNGGLILYIIKRTLLKDKVINLTVLEVGFISYALGISFYILWIYFCHLLMIYNFFTAFLPFLIIANITLILLIKTENNRNSLKKVLTRICENYREFLIFSIIVTISFFLIFFRIWKSVLLNDSLLENDPFHWTASVIYLLENQTLSFENIYSYEYPWGFIFINAGYLFNFLEFKTIYYYMKLACFPLFDLYLMIIFSISKRLFKKNTFLIIFSLICVSCSNYLIERLIRFNSSSIAVLLILISLLILLTNVPNHLIGFIAPTVFLINPLYSFFFIIAISIYYLMTVILNYKNAKSYLFEMGIISILFCFMVIPFFISNIFLGNNPVESVLNYYIGRFIKLEQFHVYFRYLLGVISTVKDLIVQFEIDPKRLFYEIFRLFERWTIGWFLAFSILGLFIKSKNISQDLKNFLRFNKIGFLVLFFVYILPYLFSSGLPLIFDKFHLRVMEPFTPCVIFLSGYCLNYLLSKAKQLSNFLLGKYKYIRPNWKKFLSLEVMKRLDSIILVLLISSSFSFYSTRGPYWVDYYYDRFLAQSVIYINTNVERGTAIYMTEIYDKPESIQQLLKNYEVDFFDNSTTFYELFITLFIGNYSYLLISFNDKYCSTDLSTKFSNNSYISFYKILGREWFFVLYKIVRK